MIVDAFQKRLHTLRMLLVGKEYYRALTALEFAMRYHSGLRKDGMTPEFDHQVQMSLFALTLPDLIDEEGTIVTIILHDTTEDYPVHAHDIMAAVFYDPRDEAFGRVCCDSIELLNKYQRDGTPKEELALYAEVARDPRASISKGIDRFHNFKTMRGVFGIEKQLASIEFAETRILPMLKMARRLFPRQTRAYENLKWMLSVQIEMIRDAIETPLASARRIDITEAVDS